MKTAECETDLDTLDSAILRLKIGLGKRPRIPTREVIADLDNAQRAFREVVRCVHFEALPAMRREIGGR